MHIILLSGGSGKRLWPLSNEARSKQFLKLLNHPSGVKESMLQRVFRQIRENGITSPIVIATSAAQEDSIKSQIGNDTEIVLEPERRNTYPAIALAAVYLALEKHVPDDEAVIVVPVDPYVDNEYFGILKKMGQAVQEDIAELVLMGIRPTEPAERFGYITLQNHRHGQEYFMAKNFKEKPTKEEAQEMITEGALWNAGVFAFKLGWLLRQIAQAGIIDSYQSFRKHYHNLQADSFDRKIAEKANSVAVIPYDGIWKDIGTWNTLTEKMDTDKIGKVITGEFTQNTHIINELEIPVIVLGAKNMVVAASPDGILVSSKEASSYLKQYVDHFEQRPMYEERRWGEYKVVDYTTYSDQSKSLAKHLYMEAGKHISYQKHKLRDEIWTIVDGRGELLVDGCIRHVQRGDVAYIAAGMKHALKAVTDMHFMEIQIGKELTEDDIIRYDYSW